jgi:hypothetical protein
LARAEGTIDASPRPEDSYLVPGVEENDAKAGEVLDVMGSPEAYPRHKGEAVFKGRGGDDGQR